MTDATSAESSSSGGQPHTAAYLLQEHKVILAARVVSRCVARTLLALIMTWALLSTPNVRFPRPVGMVGILLSLFWMFEELAVQRRVSQLERLVRMLDRPQTNATWDDEYIRIKADARFVPLRMIAGIQTLEPQFWLFLYCTLAFVGV